MWTNFGRQNFYRQNFDDSTLKLPTFADPTSTNTFGNYIST